MCLVLTVVVIVAAVITDAVSQKHEGQLEVVAEPEEDQDGELTMTDGSVPEEAKDKVFIPTDEWQTLEPGNPFYLVSRSLCDKCPCFNRILLVEFLNLKAIELSQAFT